MSAASDAEARVREIASSTYGGVMRSVHARALLAEIKGLRRESAGRLREINQWVEYSKEVFGYDQLEARTQAEKRAEQAEALAAKWERQCDREEHGRKQAEARVGELLDEDRGAARIEMLRFGTLLEANSRIEELEAWAKTVAEHLELWDQAKTFSGSGLKAEWAKAARALLNENTEHSPASSTGRADADALGDDHSGTSLPHGATHQDAGSSPAPGATTDPVPGPDDTEKSDG